MNRRKVPRGNFGGFSRSPMLCIDELKRMFERYLGDMVVRNRKRKRDVEDEIAA